MKSAIIKKYIYEKLFGVVYDKHELVVIDDIFPLKLSPFRLVEYSHILANIPGSAVYSSGKSFFVLGDNKSFKQVHEEYSQSNPDAAQRVFEFNKSTKISAHLCYVTFLNNAHDNLKYLRSLGIPFVLELYPGGGFKLNDKRSDKRLKRVTNSPLFKKVIVTQEVTSKYLINKGFCLPEQIEFVFGGVFPAEQLTKELRPKRYFPRDKEHLDICFVAHKYMERGRDKGYDVFIEVAHMLAKLLSEVSFHVVGPFDATDIDISLIENRITFHGSRTTDFFPTFYAGMDIILSPNAPDILSPGAFDGFPTGACIEAALCGTVIFACDLMELNPFRDGEEIVIIPRDPSEICRMILEYAEKPELLYQIARNSQNRFQETFSIEKQMAPRLQILKQLLSNGR